MDRRDTEGRKREVEVQRYKSPEYNVADEGQKRLGDRLKDPGEGGGGVP